MNAAVSAEKPLICIIAGEPSGDLLGARLMAALRRQSGGQVRFMGLGGEAMQAEGLETLFDIAHIAVMGFAEILPRLAKILCVIRGVVSAIEAAQPDMVVTIDSWGFARRVQKVVQQRFPHIARIHYVAPMVWAWKEKRAKAVAGTVEHLLCLLPDEPRYFSRYGLAVTYVGHPVVDSGADRGNGERFRRVCDIPETAPVLCVLPGSRRGEVSRLLPVFGEVVHSLIRTKPDLRVIIPTVATVQSFVRAETARWVVPVTIVTGEAQRYDAFAASRAALAASGTVSLELALAGVPHCIAYKVSAITAAIFRRISSLKYVDLVNLTLDRLVIPEFLQEHCTLDRIVPVVDALMTDEDIRNCQQHAFQQVASIFRGGKGAPGSRAAEVILEILSERRKYHEISVLAHNDSCS